MRLIDADALIQKVKEEEDERHLDKDCASSLQFLIDEYAEPVDAVSVIRCKYCEHADEHADVHLFCMMFGSCVKNDDYCSWARRKEE